MMHPLATLAAVASKTQRLPCVLVQEHRRRIAAYGILESICRVAVRHFDQNGGRLLYLVGQVVNPIKTLRQTFVQHFQPGGPVQIGTLFTVIEVEGCEHHRDRSSKLSVRIELRQALLGFLDAPLFRPDPTAKREADAYARAAVIQQTVGAIEGTLRPFYAQTSSRQLKIKHVDHCPESSWDMVPSQNQLAQRAFVPAALARSGWSSGRKVRA